MRLFKLQVIVAAVAFLFGAIKGFSFFGGDYQSSFLLTLYAPSVSFIIAFACLKTGVYRVIDSGDRKTLLGLGVASILVWALMFGLQLDYGMESQKVTKSCDDLKIQDFLITGVVWVIVPFVYLFRYRGIISCIK
jgi:hypothetical protein